MKKTLENTEPKRQTTGAKKAKTGEKPREVVSVTKKKKVTTVKKKTKPGPKSKYATPEEAYAISKEKSRRREEKISREGRDIAPLPEVKNPEQKEACRNDFMKFCKTYLLTTFGLAWSTNHETICRTMQEAALKGGSFAWCDSRGGGKTTICEAFSVWCLVYGHAKFLLYIGATKEAATDSFESFKWELENNELLLADFPEIVFPIHALDGKANKAKGQTFNEESTRLVWSRERCILPVIPGSANGGGMFISVGYDGRLRGRKFKNYKGENVRPDCVLFDDVQKDKTGRNPQNATNLLDLLKRTVKGLKARNKKLTLLVPGTKLNPNCFMSQITDVERNPAYQGRTYKALYKFPENMDLWKTYRRLWVNKAEEIRTNEPSANDAWQRGKNAATEFYRKNRAAMDAGAEVAWPEAHEEDELSGLQSLMSIYLDDEAYFFTEYQNEPVSNTLGGVELDNKIFAGKILNSLPRGVAPLYATHLTLGIDVQQNILYWMVVAWGRKFTGHVCDYGSFPDQKSRMFTAHNAPFTLEKRFGGQLEGQLRQGLTTLSKQLIHRAWRREDRSPIAIQRGLVDANWPPSLDPVRSFVSEMLSQNPNFPILPSRGKKASAIGKFYETNRAKMRSWTDYSYVKKMEPTTEACDTVWVNTNKTKSAALARLLALVGDPGSVTIHAGDSETHRLLYEHFTAETYRLNICDGHEQDMWERRPNRTENHWWDCFCLNIVANAMTGDHPEGVAALRKPLPVFTFDDMMKGLENHAQQ